MLSVLALISCSEENLDTTQENGATIDNEAARRLEPTEPLTTTNPTTANFYAGQNTLMGTVSASYDSGTITLTYEVTDWEIEETHLYIGTYEDRPRNNPGNPMIGQFPLAGEHDPGTNTVTYTVTVGGDIPCSGIIAAHAVVNDGSGGSETAWACCEDYGGNSWAMYFVYDLCE